MPFSCFLCVLWLALLSNDNKGPLGPSLSALSWHVRRSLDTPASSYRPKACTVCELVTKLFLGIGMSVHNMSDLIWFAFEGLEFYYQQLMLLSKIFWMLGLNIVFWICQTVK